MISERFSAVENRQQECSFDAINFSSTVAQLDLNVNLNLTALVPSFNQCDKHCVLLPKY